MLHSASLVLLATLAWAPAVLDPGRVAGEVHFLGPPPDPVLGSPLEDLDRASDHDLDADGVPDPGAWTSQAQWGSKLNSDGVSQVAPGALHTSAYGAAYSELAGAYDPATEAFEGDYETVLGGLYREPSYWRVGRLTLVFKDTATPAVPESYEDSVSTVSSRIEPLTLVTPGSRQIRPARHCFGQVRLRICSASGTFRQPTVRAVVGELVGLDFELRPVNDQLVVGTSSGTPQSTSASDGLVVLTLREGTYTLDTRVIADNPGGGTSNVGLNPVDVTLPCRGIIDEWIDFQIALDPVARCTASSSIPVTGAIAGDPVDRIEYAVNGGAAVAVCAACGTSPSFAFSAALVPGLNSIQVTALAADGRRALASVVVTVAPLPRDLGNVLLGVKEGPDAHFHWTAAPGSSATRLDRDTAKRFTSSSPLLLVPLPDEDGVDRGAVTRLAEPLDFYRVRGTNCGGEPGP